MKILNIDEFRKCMYERSWDADAYLSEVERKIDERGYFNEDFVVHPEENNGYYDNFTIVSRGIFDGDVLVSEPIYFFCEV